GEEGRFFGAVACLLLVSSPAVFEFATQSVLPELPYLLFTFLVLLASRELEAAEGVGTRIASRIAVAVALVASLMLRTAALALLTGLILWMASSYVTEKKLALRRLRAFLPLLLLGILVQTLCASWSKLREVAEWPLNGH